LCFHLERPLKKFCPNPARVQPFCFPAFGKKGPFFGGHQLFDWSQTTLSLLRGSGLFQKTSRIALARAGEI
jgi:hypothetical protein